jgi:hypothetical protein
MFPLPAARRPDGISNLCQNFILTHQRGQMGTKPLFQQNSGHDHQSGHVQNSEIRMLSFEWRLRFARLLKNDSVP